MTTNGKQARILVVDDAPLIRGLLVQVLQKFGYQVDTAEDGQQAIDCFLQKHPDLILMDADMPVLDGVAACNRIKQYPQAKHLPIVMVTSFVEREWVDRAYAAGAIDYVTKPVNWDVLRNRIHYILQAKQAEEALFEEKEKAQVTLASIGDGVITTDAKGRVEYLNAVASELTGFGVEEAQGLPLNQVFSVLDENSQQPIEFPIHRCLTEGAVIELASNTVLVHRNLKQFFAIEDSAAPIKDRQGNIIGVVVVFHDVTENRKMTMELSYKAKHDALTGLYNRDEFSAQLNRVLQYSQREGSEQALLYLDLDKFKIVNDTCGHEAGDQLLKDVALLLQETVQEQQFCPEATLARLGGDEFGLLLEHCSQADALTVANMLCQAIEKFRFFWGTEQTKNTFTIGLSIGLVSLSDSKNLNQKNALAMADAACYRAKHAGRHRVHVYQGNEVAFPHDNNVQWVSLIHQSLESEHGLSLFYQPIVSLHHPPAKGVHYEILLRLDNQEGQLVPPGAFLSVAKRYSLMSNLDLWVIRTVLSWLTSHPQRLDELDFNTINISSQSLSDKKFLDTLITYLQKTTVPLDKICFEIDETTVLTNLTDSLKFINPLKQLGCRLALDNFGSGIASFSYVKNLPMDFLKIEGALIKNILADPIDHTVVKSINEIAHQMRWQTIAEHVEKPEVMEKLKELEIDYVQGYICGRPRPLENGINGIKGR